MALVHTVKAGECLASIAAAHTLDPAFLHTHPDNAELRRARPNWNVLCPGDRVTIPDRDVKNVEVATGKLHRFVVKQPKVELDVRLVDDYDEPLADVKYRLIVANSTLDGSTDGDGHVRAPLPAAAMTAELHVWADDPDSDAPSDSFLLELGALRPADDNRGVQARLANLGYWCATADGDIGPRSRHALKAFQGRHDLSITGEIDDAARGKVEAEHGC